MPQGLPDGRVPVVLSAHADELVASDASAILRYLRPHHDVSSVAATLLRTRRLRRHRAVVRAANLDELTGALRAVGAGGEHPLVVRSARTGAARTAFVFPGQGSQWPSMGADAYRQSPVYRTHVDRCTAAFVAAGAQSPLPYLTAESDGGPWSQVQIQGAQFTHAVGLAAVWRSCGVLPEITLGHSLGEVAAAYVAGTMSLADAVAVVIARAKVVDQLAGGYGMATLGVCAETAQQLISETSGWLEVSAVNSAASVVVSGEREAVARLLHSASARGLFARELEVNYPGHTSALEPLHDELRALLPVGAFADAPVRFVSSATSQVVRGGTDFADYWSRNLRNTVRFDQAAAVARQHGVTTFIEISAHPSLLFALGDLTDDCDDAVLAVGSGSRDTPWVDALSANIATVAAADPDFRWPELVDVERPVLRGFPNAPMRATRLWAEPRPLPPVASVSINHEKWQQARQFADSATARSLAVVDIGTPGSPLSTHLRNAVQRHNSTQLADPRDAELVVAVAPLLDHPEAELAVEHIAALIDTGMLGYADVAGPMCREVCIVTVGGEQVRPDEPVALPAQAALAAMHRSIGYEYPDQAFRHLDLPSWVLDDAVADAAVDALLSGTQETALRETDDGIRCFTRTLAEAAEPAAWPLDSGVLDDVVITGGSGAVGRQFARYLAERGARRIVLLSRSGVAADVKAELGPRVEVVAPRCDVTDAQQVSAAAREHGRHPASLVIHAAGTAAFADRGAVTADGFTQTAAAKLSGLARVVELWPLRPDARILACSSVSGVWGGRGHAAYSAVNRMLDVVAGQLRAKGCHCVAARYGLWDVDSDAASAITDAAGIANIERSGLLPMPPEGAVTASLREHPADPLILTADHDRLQVFLDSQAVARTRSAATAVDDSADTTARVRAELGAVLKLDPGSIDLDASLLDLGVDSLLALDLRNRLRRATGASVPLATLLGGITGGELIASLDTAQRPEKVKTRD